MVLIASIRHPPLACQAARALVRSSTSQPGELSDLLNQSRSIRGFDREQTEPMLGSNSILTGSHSPGVIVLEFFEDDKLLSAAKVRGGDGGAARPFCPVPHPELRSLRHERRARNIT
jgi:hypothetical protein